MDIRSVLKEKEKKFYKKMSRGKRLELALELSAFAIKLRKNVKTHGKRVQGVGKRAKRN